MHGWTQTELPQLSSLISCYHLSATHRHKESRIEEAQNLSMCVDTSINCKKM